jgi:hypothetical protein
MINLEIINKIKNEKLTIAQAADLFSKLKPTTLQSRVRRFCKEKNLESPFPKPGRPPIKTFLKEKILIAGKEISLQELEKSQNETT